VDKKRAFTEGYPHQMEFETNAILWYFSRFCFFVAIWQLIYFFKKGDADYMQEYVYFDSLKLMYVDSMTTAIFLVGMLFMALKRIENWIYWIIGNIISVPLYFQKGFVFTSFQYLAFLGLAIAGLIAWINIYEEEKNAKELSQHSI
jgi:nicotinamide mononucleotide transporter PnuC